MARVAVLGAGVVGLTSAMLLTNDGHDVVVVERDTTEPSGDPDEVVGRRWRRG